jgi:hypothetical protein
LLVLVLVLVLASTGCGRFGYDPYALAQDGAPDDIDAVTPPTIDADPNAPDADPSAPDADPNGPVDAAPDASPSTPDAAPDASSSTPDAGGGTGTTGPEVPIVTGTSDSQHPSMAFDGTGFDFVWDDTRISTSNLELYMTRLPVGATAILNPPVRLTNASGYSGFPSIAWSGSDLGVAWEDGREGTDEIYFARWNTDLAAIGTQTRISLGAGAGFAYDPSLQWNGSRFGVAWNSGSGSAADVFFVQVNASNSPVGNAATVTTAAGASSRSSLAWSGAEYGMAWQDLRDGFSRMYVSRATAQGSVLGPDAHVGAGTNGAFSASMASNGTVYGLAYEDKRSGSLQIYVSLVAANGTQTGTDLKLAPGTEPSIAWAGDHFAVLYVNTSGVLILMDLTPDGTGIAISRVYAGEGHASEPQLLWTGNSFAAVWQDNRSGTWDIYFREVKP